MWRILFILMFCSINLQNSSAQLLRFMYAERIRKAKIDSLFAARIKTDSIFSLYGNTDAKYRFGIYCYYNNKGTIGANLIKEAAELSHVQAIRFLGELEYYGEYFKKNQSKAYQRFMQAAAQNDSLSLCYLGICNYYGHGTSRDYNKAVNYFRNCLNSSDQYIKDLSLYYIAKCLRYGRGCEKNIGISNLIILERSQASHIGQKVLSELLYHTGVTLNSYDEKLVKPSYDITGIRPKHWTDDALFFLNNKEYEQLEEDADGLSGNYTHILSFNNENVEVCKENRLLFLPNGIKYRIKDKLYPIVVFKESQNILQLRLGSTTFSTNEQDRCVIDITHESDFTYKVKIHLSNKTYIFSVSKRVFRLNRPTFGLG